MTPQKEHAAKRPRPPRSWSMRAKLMGFIVLMVAVLLGLVWFLGVRSLGTFSVSYTHLTLPTTPYV